MADEAPEEEVDPPASDGSTASPHPNSPPRGPPPPRPIWVLREASYNLSAALGTVIQSMGGQIQEVLTHPPFDWQEHEGLVMDIRPMRPSDRFHPHVMWVGDGTPPRDTYHVPGTDPPLAPNEFLAGAPGTATMTETEAPEAPTRDTAAGLEAAAADAEWDEILRALDIPTGDDDLDPDYQVDPEWALRDHGGDAGESPCDPQGSLKHAVSYALVDGLGIYRLNGHHLVEHDPRDFNGGDTQGLVYNIRSPSAG
ncbi:unnamed protein product [Symbiodinium sp. CCMP2456]|nr:unnamed protein product [Symbiodinium sp. CCMP2456]